MMGINWKRELVHWLILVGMVVLYFAGGPFNPAPEGSQLAQDIVRDNPGAVKQVVIQLDIFILMLVMAFILYGLMLFLPRIDPLQRSYSLFTGSYETVRLTVLAMFAGLFVVMVYGFRTPNFRTAMAVPVFIGVALIVVGNLLGKIRPNWFFGIPTPWTLSSREAWQKTNRLGGWLITLFGLTVIPSGFKSGLFAFMLLVGGSCLILLVLVVYSYVAYRQDKQRISPFVHE